MAELGGEFRVGHGDISSARAGSSAWEGAGRAEFPIPPEPAARAEHCSRARSQRFMGHHLLSSKPVANSVLSAADTKWAF